MMAEPITSTGASPPTPALATLCVVLLEQMPLAMALIEGASQTVTYVNPAFGRLMDKHPKQLVGKSFSEMLPDKDKCRMLLDRVLRTGKPERHTERDHAERQTVFWAYTMWPILAEERPAGVLMQVAEITEPDEKTLAFNEALTLGSVRQHELAEAADQLNIRLAAVIDENARTQIELLAAKDQIDRHAAQLEQLVVERTLQLQKTVGELEGFSYSVSHDMRAPLRAMQGYGQFLVDEYGGKLDEKAINYLQQIMRSAVRLDRLIQDVLSYTHILHAPLPLESVDLDRLVRDIAETYPNDQARLNRQIQIVGQLPRVMGNEALLTQCIANLLSNGAKFVAPGTVPRLEISAEATPANLVRLWIKDNGIGIAPENHTRIFRVFERVHAETEYPGTGIGLAIVSKAIERMGATIGFESALGQGTQFWMEFEKG